jgi:hypothetical protein
MTIMPSSKFHRVAALLLVGGGLLGCATVARSQDSQQTESVADAARRAREQKKNAAKASTSKSSKVITNDDVSKPPKPAEGVNAGAPARLETQPPSQASVAAVESADQAAASSGDSAKKSEDPEITKLKEQVAQVAKDLDLLKRELVLDSDTFYSNTDYVHDKAGQTKLANEQQQINAKQQELDELKARLQDLEARKKPSEATASDKPKQ